MGRLTLWGMQQYDGTLLDGIVLPDGMDVASFKELLNYRLGPAFPYIQVPYALKSLIRTWFQTRQYDFSQMYAALHAQYSPIENYDRTEDRTLKASHSGTDTDTNTLGTQVVTKRTGTEAVHTDGTESMTRTGTENTKETGTSTTEQQVSAYDASNYVPREKALSTPNLDTTRTPNLTDTHNPDLTETRTPDLTDTSTNSGSDVKKTDYGHVQDDVEHIRAHGNIGVTTNQQMIESELEMRMQYDLYELIIQLFEREFMSRVY